MTIETQLDMGTGTVHSERLEALQAILIAQGEAVSYKDAVEIGHELISFFEALGEKNGQFEEANHA